ncbi:ATP-binding SpoIIE family protein phosphatase [Streptomyces sp. PU10]|uniref:ATP-binding SpoIIE family protein phosphatase n=1 Tax=unclassified Streptomyces TaxID=2593676 RepID=UPI0015909BBE|nr:MULTISPECIES: ATP-binding SpoIIE family protein phosphatase [unclassified Streptomyces]MDU0253869.1 ATP-binding SpoIIE family protein phosphatase [Streptomyces sp. PU10]QKW63367.1 SpoIIE family protein phosphatase [Streptomyces sp. NA03103]WSU03728.1 SpoIIE family protein phosphatase [Streptomyces sp. NBC_01124]
MSAIPRQRETASRAGAADARAAEASAEYSGEGASVEVFGERFEECARARVTLLGSSLAPGAARAMARAALADWSALGLPGTEHLTEHLTADALVVVSELVTNAVVHAGTDVEVGLRVEETGTLVVEVADRHPSRAPSGGGDHETPHDPAEYGRGLRLVAALAEAWGITYRPGSKTVWARLPAGGAEPADGAGAGAGLAEATPAGAGVEGVGVPGATARTGTYAGGAHGTPPTGAVVPEDPDGPHDASGVPARPGRRRTRDREWLGRGALSFLAEASDLLAGQLDEDLVASLTGQLIVPRLADWCGVWLEDETLGRGAWSDDSGTAVGARLARVWYAGEGHLDELRAALEKEPPRPRDPWRSGPVGHPWPAEALGTHGTALAYRLVAGGRPLGTLVIGRAGPPDPTPDAPDAPGAQDAQDAPDTGGHPDSPGFPDEITGLVEDLSRRVALAIGAARQYARQATISAVLQRGLLPGAVAEIPGVRSALVYEPRDKGGPSGDFYDLFPAGDGRWCFAVGDVQGKGPEAAVVIGLARPWLRLLAREQYGVPDVLDRLNQLLLDDATEAADAAARALVAAGGPPVAPGDGPQTRFLSLLYGELVPFEGGVRCTLASAGHPLPLLLGPDGTVSAVACPQTLLGVVEDATYVSESFELRSGDTLLCVTDGVTERRSGSRQFDDDDGLAEALAGCTGLDAELVAERIRRLVHEFGPRPPEDDLALLVLQAE